MKLLLLHGPGKLGSRSKLISVKNKFDENAVVVFEEGFDMQSILGSLMTPQLFSNEQLIILENPPEDLVPTTNYQLPTTLLLWFDHEVSEKKPIMEWVREQKGEIIYFPESKEVSVFPFLDYLAANDKRAFLEAEKLKRAGYEIYYLITMVFYLIRSLLAVPKNAPQFVQDKLERQRKKFDLEKIKNLYKDMLDLDFKLKSGLLEKEQAEFLMINKFIN